MSKLMLDVGTANEIKMALRRADATEFDVKAMCEGDFMKGVLGLLHGEFELTPIAKAVASALLVLVGTATFPGTTSKFVVKDNFVINTEDDTKVKISYLGDNLKSWFIGKVEGPLSRSELRYQNLKENSLDSPIITKLGGEEKAESSLAEMFHLMSLQKNGEEGALLNNGWANIFYIRDVNGVLRAVYVDWYVDGWRVRANSVGHRGGWDGGNRVFSRNSVTV